MKIMNNTDKLAKIAINKSLLKEFHNSQNERIVYLNDGDEFQIQIFNPYTYVIGVALSFNSNNIDNSNLLVVRPGERIWLDRYLNDNRKFKFYTYEVNNSNDVKKAIANNGILNVYFYKEKEYNPYYISKLTYIEPAIDVYYSANSIPTTITTSCSSCSSNDNNIKNTVLSSFASTIETGRIEKGNISNQKFDNYYGNFESWYFKQETIKLLPQSQKQINSSDLKKKYCYNCGKKIKSEFKYCPNCGAKQ